MSQRKTRRDLENMLRLIKAQTGIILKMSIWRPDKVCYIDIFQEWNGDIGRQIGRTAVGFGQAYDVLKGIYDFNELREYIAILEKEKVKVAAA